MGRKVVDLRPVAWPCDVGQSSGTASTDAWLTGLDADPHLAASVRLPWGSHTPTGARDGDRLN